MTAEEFKEYIRPFEIRAAAIALRPYEIKAAEIALRPYEIRAAYWDETLHPRHSNGRFKNKSLEMKLFAGGGVDKSKNINIIKITGNDVTIPKEKLIGYSLSYEKCPDKARTFQSVLGFTAQTADVLEARIREAFSSELLTPKGDDGYGMRYEAVMLIKGINGNSAFVTTGWIDDKVKKEFRMTSTYIKARKGKHTL